MQITTTQSSLIPLYRLIIISTLLALLAVLAYFVLPEKKERILPAATSQSHLFFDAQNGGKIHAQWVDQDSYHFICNAADGGIELPYCGLSINFQQASTNLDYSQYQRMELKINYQGNNQRLRFKMHSFRPALSNDKFRETLRGLEVSFLATETSTPVVIDNHGWGATNDYIFSNTSTPAIAEKNKTAANNTIDIGIDLVPPIVAGEHRIQLEYIDVYDELLPADVWYLGVAIIWLTSNLLFIARHLIAQERRIRNDSQRLSTLAHYSNDLQQESQHYKLLSNTDALTGALNRNGFATEMSQRSPNGKMLPNTTLMIIDLDNFKRINDRRGHDAGDAVLRETAQVIHKNTRTTDRFIRWGGEEFILFCENTNAQQALVIAEKIRAAIEAMSVVHHEDIISVTVSMGLGVAVAQENFDDLFHRTDQALYRAKHMGRNCVVLSNSST
ncbi:GGDEF domain-containing protein [Cellvibrio mixtus]|uniref:GGDEF domain-containing protein n=1 Tax=Cellvibrio mixtus TaxID=39650 RepID=UPI000586B465|nr:GGDEF domain-containing protein [Cellvibrio mixtus]